MTISFSTRQNNSNLWISDLTNLRRFIGLSATMKCQLLQSPLTHNSASIDEEMRLVFVATDISVHVREVKVTRGVLSADWVYSRSSFKSRLKIFQIIAAVENENGNFNPSLSWPELFERNFFFSRMEMLKYLSAHDLGFLLSTYWEN